MRIDVKFSQTNQKLNAQFNKINERLDVRFGEVKIVTVIPEKDQYEGDYIVTPKISAQTIPTKKKYLIDDMTVKAIPYFNVSNTTGGSTVYIGSTLD